MSETERLAFVGTPRSGNTWLHRMLAETYGLEIRTAHCPADLDWDALPSCCLVQLHWHPTEDFMALLRRHGFKAVVMFRHPLDTLVSILHFALHDDTSRWLDGENGGESPVIHSSPSDAAFLEYALGPRAASLLALSGEWSKLPGVFSLRYETLVEEPVAQLQEDSGMAGMERSR